LYKRKKIFINQTWDQDGGY